MGVVSIGVVPMGVISLGVVGMGVLNAAAVGMGVLIAGVNVMGVWWVGLEGMGPFRLGARAALVHSQHGHARPATGAGALVPDLQTYPSRELAAQKARELGCVGAHRMGNLWMPCEEHPHP